MTPTHATAAPAGELPLRLLTLYQEDWPTLLRYALAADDVMSARLAAPSV